MKKAIIILFYILSFSLNAQVSYPPVKGVWLTNVDSKALFSKQNIIDAVSTCESTGINTIFVVVWNKAMTLYPSQVMKKMFGEQIDPCFAGRDPLKELIEEAHKRDIKVIAWFEFGFSSSYQLDGGRLLKLHPEWASKDNQGKLVQKNGFEWMNGFLPEVQDFMLSLIMEVVRQYNIDGIQGDDRLPAMPVESGYDKYTASLYKKEHKGANPPKDFRDTAWVNWRADKMTQFMSRIHSTVKSVRKDIIISMSPSVFPWGRDEYLQDWPTWVKRGYVDMVCPQLYRYDVKGYIELLDNIVNSQLSKEDRNKFYPGILLKLGDYDADHEYLKQIISENRKRDVNGEVYFFYEGVKKFPEFFKSVYINDQTLK